METNRVIYLVIVKLERFRHYLSPGVEHHTTWGHVFHISLSRTYQILHVEVACGFLIDTSDLMQEWKIHGQDWKLFETSHLECEHLVQRADLCSDRHSDGNEQTDSVMLCNLGFSIGKDSLISEVSLLSKYGQIFTKALDSSMLSRGVPHGNENNLFRHQLILFKEKDPTSVRLVLLDEMMHIRNFS